MIRVIISFVLMALVTGCVTASYSPPYVEEQDKSAYQLTVNRSYEETWDGLVQYAGKTFFGIENFEKDSGLMTLSFGTSAPSEFIDCGYIKIDAINPNTFEKYKYSGSYVAWLIQQHNADFNGAMNIVVSEVNEQETRVSINARYVFSSPPTTWVFNTGGYDTIAVQNPLRGTGSTRTCEPTYKAEKAVLQGITGLVSEL